MGKLLLVLFTAVAIQAVCGGTTKGYYGYGQEDLKDLIRQVALISDKFIENLRTIPLRHGASLETREFVQEIEDIINYLETLHFANHDEDGSGSTTSIQQELREIRAHFQELWACDDETCMGDMEMTIATIISKVVNHMEAWVKMVDGESYNGTRKSFVQKIMVKLVSALEKLNERFETYKTGDVDRKGLHTNQWSEYGDNWNNQWSNSYLSKKLSSNAHDSSAGYYNGGEDIHALYKELEVSVGRIRVENVLTQRTFLHLTREYLDNLQIFKVPELDSLYDMFLYNKKPMQTVAEIKVHLFTFSKTFLSNIERMPKTAHVAFAKASRKFQSRLEIMLQVNTPVRQMVFRIHTLADVISALYELVPVDVATSAKKQIVENSRHFSESLESLRLRIHGRENQESNNWRSANTGAHQSLTLAVQEATTEVHKWILFAPTEQSFQVLTEYYKILKAERVLLTKVYLGVNNIDFWSTHLLAVTNQMGIYFHGDVNGDDKRVLAEAFKEIFEILESGSHPEYKKVTQALKFISDEFKTQTYPINTFLEKVSLELNQLIWEIHERTQTFPSRIKDILILYLNALEEIQMNHRVSKGLLMVQRPTEITMKIENIADRLTKVLHIMVPGFQHNKLVYTAHRFYQMLEIVTSRLHTMTIHGFQQSPGSMKSVYKNLRDIQSSLQDDFKQHDMYFKVKLGMYIQRAVLELKSLAFEREFEQDAEFVKMYGNFMFGMKQLFNQVQYDMQLVSEQYSIETLQMQISSVAHHISSLLLRTQIKPELNLVILTQVRALAAQIEGLWRGFEQIPTTETLATQYKTMHTQFMQVIAKGKNMPVKEICAFLEVSIRDIVVDLNRLTYLGLESPEFYFIYKYTLTVFGNIMVRLDNVHFYEYYHAMITNKDVTGDILKMSSAIAAKLRSPLIDTPEIKYDLTTQILKYAYRFERVATRFHVESGVPLTNTYTMYTELLQLVRPKTGAINELKVKLGQSVTNIAREFQRILTEESHVGTKNGLTRYLEALEKLYVNVDNIVERNNEGRPLYKIIADVETYSHYLVKALEHISSDDKKAMAVFCSEYRRFVEFVAEISNRLGKLDNHAKFQRTLNKLSQFALIESQNTEDGNEVKLRLSLYVEHITYALKKLTWLAPEISEVRAPLSSASLTSKSTESNMIIKSIWCDFLLSIQRMPLEIGMNVIVPQRIQDIKRWGMLQGLTSLKNLEAENDFNTGNNEDRYGPFTKYFSKLGRTNHDVDRDSDWNASYNKDSNTSPQSHMYTGHLSRDFDGAPKIFGIFAYISSNDAQIPEYGILLSMKQYHESPMKYKSTPQYVEESTRVTDHQTEDTSTLIKHIRQIVNDVTQDLRKMSSTKYEGELSFYARQLAQILDNIIAHLDGKKTEFDAKHTINIFKQLQPELMEMAVTLGQDGGSKYQLSNVIEQVTTELERLTRVVSYNQGQDIKGALVQFYSYIRNLKTNMTDSALTRNFESSKTGHNYSENPWFYMQNRLRVPTTSERKYL